TTQDNLNELVAYNLVEWDEVSSRYHLHDIVRLFAYAQSNEDERLVGQQRHAQYYLNILQQIDLLYQQDSTLVSLGLSRFDIEWVNIRVGQAWAMTNAASDDIAAQLCSKYPNAGAYILNLRLHQQDWIQWLEAALTAARQLKDYAGECNHLSNLGNAYYYGGNIKKAIDLFEQNWIIARELNDRQGAGNALFNMSLALNDIGQCEQAISYAEVALNLFQQIEDSYAEIVRAQLSEWRTQRKSLHS
ncbi:MAG: tetratricopeptide repeat protein, partial [Acidobacteriota bacterium]